MKIYKDKALMEEIMILDLDILPAGETKRYTFWIFNDLNAKLKELEFTVEHDEVEVIEAPLELESQAVGEIILEWNPSITLKEGLKTRLRVKGKELWG